VIYDLLGQEVATLVEGTMEPGYQQVVWDSKDQRGRSVPSGIYVARLVTAEYAKSIRLVLLK
jgi:flagellar hook assembly protein FlgD